MIIFTLHSVRERSEKINWKHQAVTFSASQSDMAKYKLKTADRIPYVAFSHLQSQLVNKIQLLTK